VGQVMLPEEIFIMEEFMVVFMKMFHSLPDRMEPENPEIL